MVMYSNGKQGCLSTFRTFSWIDGLREATALLLVVGPAGKRTKFLSSTNQKHYRLRQIFWCDMELHM